MKNNQSGFTLVELLAVIVILAVVMLIGVTAVGPLMARARKSALGTETIALMKAAQTAYQAEQLGTSNVITSITTACFNTEYLYNFGYYEKAESQKYRGSVMVIYEGSGKYSYRVWLTNGAFYYYGIDPNNYNPDTDAHDDTGTLGQEMYRCGIENLVGDTDPSKASNGAYCISLGCQYGSEKVQYIET